MDITKFSESKTGTLVPIKAGHADDYAFIPDKLPPKWFLPPALVPKLIDARAAISLLDGIGRTLLAGTSGSRFGNQNLIIGG